MTPRVIKHAQRLVVLERMLKVFGAHETLLAELARTVPRPVLRAMLTCVCQGLYEIQCTTVDDLVESREAIDRWTMNARERFEALLDQVKPSIAQGIRPRIGAGEVLPKRAQRTLLRLDRKAGSLLTTWNQLARIHAERREMMGETEEGPGSDEIAG